MEVLLRSKHLTKKSIDVLLKGTSLAKKRKVLLRIKGLVKK
jgi:hypothetical protein